MSWISSCKKNPFDKVKSNIMSLKNISSSISTSTIFSLNKEGEENIDDSKGTPFSNDENMNSLKDLIFNTSPNKPLNTKTMITGVNKTPIVNHRYSYIPLCASSNKENITEVRKEIKHQPNSVSKNIDKIEDSKDESWSSNIFSLITNLIYKVPTNHRWKWSEQDKSLSWWARSAKWVRDAESRRSRVPNQAEYLKEYQNLKDIIDQGYSTNLNDSIDTRAWSNFELQLIQIEKDIERTMNSDEYFSEGQEGRENLRILLKIIALKYTDIGYVQGMNFLVVSLLYHWSPEITLFLITVLMEDYELWDIYREDVLGLHSRNNVIREIVQKRLPDLFDHFIEIGIEPQMFTTEWILDLFSHIIPINMYGKFLDSFISDGDSNSGEVYLMIENVNTQ